MWSVIVALTLAASEPPPPRAPQSVDELVGLIQAHLDEVRDFEAHFTQRYVRRIARRVIEESGVVAV